MDSDKKPMLCPWAFGLPFFLLSPLFARADACSVHDLNCKHLANILLTPKGVEKILREQLDVNLLNNTAREQIRTQLQKQVPITLMQSSPNCAAEISPSEFTKQAANLREKQDGCFYYPVIEQNGSDIKVLRYVPFRVRLANFDLQGSKFDVKDVRCQTAQKCTAAVQATRISAVGQVVIESMDGQLLERPHLELSNKKGTTPATAQFELELRPGGELVSALGNFDQLNLQLGNTELRPAVVDDKGKLLSPEESRSMQRQTAATARTDFFQRQYASGDSNLSAPSLKALTEEVSRLNELRDIRGLPKIPLDTFLTALKTWKKNPQKYPDIFNELPSFQSLSENGAANARGFSTPVTASVFNGIVDAINTDFATDPKVQALVKVELNKRLKDAEIGINKALEQISGDLGRTFIQVADLPVAAVEGLVRLGTINGLLEDYEKVLAKPTLTSKARSEFLGAQKKLLDERQALNAELSKGKTLAVLTRPFFDKVNDMNRIGLFAGGETCPPPTHIQQQGITNKDELSGAEFGFELTRDSLQGYINEIYSLGKVICLGSSEANCKGGRKITISKPPTLVVTSQGKYQLQLNGIEVDHPVFSPSLGIAVDLNVGQCKEPTDSAEKPLCLTFANGTVTDRSQSVKFNDFIFAGDTSSQQVKKGFDTIKEINLTQFLPASIRSSFNIQSPMIKGADGMLVFPMNLKTLRPLLGGKDLIPATTP